MPSAVAAIVAIQQPRQPTEPPRILPKDIRPYPKVAHDPNPKQRRTQGRTQILTLTPEKRNPTNQNGNDKSPNVQPEKRKRTDKNKENVPLPNSGNESAKRKTGHAGTTKRKNTQKNKENVRLPDSDDETQQPSHSSQSTRISRTGRIIKARVFHD